MKEILDYARARGIKRVYGDVLRENWTMLAMAAELGFTIVPTRTIRKWCRWSAT
jgi:acetyltransferase